jgi:hypothetical protein
MGKKKRIIVIVCLLALYSVYFVYACVHFYRPATCTEAAECTLCGRTSGSPLGHNYGPWETVTEPACGKEGKSQRICRNDSSHVETQPIPALNHEPTEATCTEASVCKLCGAELSPALGHDWKDATYTEPKTCRRCGTTVGNVRGYISGDDIEENLSDEKITLGETEGKYHILSEPLIGCMNVTIGFQLDEYTNDVSGNWVLWIMDGSGNWHNGGSHYFSNTSEMEKDGEYKFTFSYDQDIYAYKFALNDRKDYEWSYTHWGGIVEAQVRDD